MGRMARTSAFAAARRWILALALASWLAPCSAQEFVDDALRPLFHATLLAEQARTACAEVDPALAAGIDSGLAHLRENHRADLPAARAAAERRAGPHGLDSVAAALVRRFGERLQRQDPAGRRTECATLAIWLETHASRSRQMLVKESFAKWFAREQQARQTHCARLEGTARVLSRRLLSAFEPRQEGAPPDAPDLLRADAKVAQHAAAWCLQVQAAAARERIRVPGDFARVRDTAGAISAAMVPWVSGHDPVAALRRARDRALRTLADPSWI